MWGGHWALSEVNLLGNIFEQPIHNATRLFVFLLLFFVFIQHSCLANMVFAWDSSNGVIKDCGVLIFSYFSIKTYVMDTH